MTYSFVVNLCMLLTLEKIANTISQTIVDCPFVWGFWHDIIARCSSPSYQKKIGPKFLLKLFCHLISLTRRLGCSHISDPIRRESQVKPSTRPRPRPNNFIFHKIEKPSPAPVPRSLVSAIWCQWPVQICPRPPPGQLIKLLLSIKSGTCYGTGHIYNPGL